MEKSKQELDQECILKHIALCKKTKKELGDLLFNGTIDATLYNKDINKMYREANGDANKYYDEYRIGVHQDI